MKAKASKVGGFESSVEVASSEGESASGEALPEGWAWSPVKDVVDHLRNGYVGPTRGIYHDEGIPYILSKHVRDNVLTFDDETFITQEFNEKNKKSILKAGDVLLVQTGHVGHSAVVPPKHEGHNCHALIVITPTQDCLDGHFLSYQFAGPEIQSVFGLIEKGMTLRHLNCRDVIKVPIRIAPKAEQTRIVEAIESLQERSSRARDLLAEVGPLIGQLRQSVLRAAFSGRLTADWRAANPDVRPASELLENIRTERRQRWETEQLAKYEAKGKEPPKSWKDKYKEPEPVDESKLPELPNGWCWASVEELLLDDGSLSYGILKPGEPDPDGVPMLRVMDVGDFGLKPDAEVMKVSPELSEQYKRTELTTGDIILAVMATIGRTAVVPEAFNGANVNRALAVLKLTKRVAPEYIVSVIRSPFFQDRFTREKVGTAQARINLGDLRKFAVPLANAEESRVIVEKVDEAIGITIGLESGLASMESSLTQLDQSILSKAFRGELVPQDPRDEPASELLARIRTTRKKLEAEKKATKKKVKKRKTTKKKKAKA